MRTSKSLNWLLLCALLLICGQTAFAKRGSGYQYRGKSGVVRVIYTPQDADGCPARDQMKVWWRNMPWSAAADKPYAKAKRDIDLAVGRGVSPLELSKKYKSEVSQQMWDPLKTYRWAYASWLARKKVKTKGESDAIFKPLTNHIPEMRFPNSYHYARMGFLAMAYSQPSLCIKDLGDRLLRRNAADEDVKFYMSRVLTNEMTSRDDRRAFQYLSYFRSKYPKNTYYDREYAIRVQHYLTGATRWSRKS